jgi:plasmid maintenance system antidote protein VapI
MTQYDRLKNGTATAATIAQEISASAERKPLYKRVPAHVLVEDFLIPNQLDAKDVSRIARIHPTVMHRFIRGEARIDDLMATKLGGMFRTGKDYWLNVQAAYDAGKL